MRALAAVVVASAVAAAACSSARRDLQPVSLPELTRVDEGVQKQIHERYDALTAVMNARSTPDTELANAYGSYGMVLQAAEYFDAAEPCYLNAEKLAPEEIKWPYYLANLYKRRGQTDKAEAAFKRALALRPDDLATLIWLARLNLDQGKADEAEPLFQKASTLAPGTVAVVAGLGQVAVAKRDWPAAVKYLEQALQLDPDADSLHAPLATAYRGLGEIDKARPHIGQWKNRDLPVPDPLQDQMDMLLESGLSYELRGIREFEVRDWKTAADLFRRGLALAKAGSPLRRSLQHKLGTALALMGDTAGAEQQFQAVVDEAPATGIDEATAKAHYSLALLMAAAGRVDEAQAHLEAATRYQPSYIEAHLALADFFRRHKQPAGALAEYKATLAINPRQTVARLGYAMSLVDLGRYRESRDWLDEAVKLFPDRVEFKIGLARVLSTSRDPQVRDAKRALDITQELFKGERTTALGETIAMALAEYGDFAQAVAIQRDVMAAAERAGMHEQLARMRENLALYERHQPCRTPWSEDDLVLGPSASPAAPDQAMARRVQ